MQILIKQPAEELKRELPIAGAAAIAAIESVTVESRGLVAGSVPIGAAGSLTAGLLFIHLDGGTDGERYLVTARVEDIAGEIREAELEIAVVDSAWAMPDGGAGYVSIAEFATRFGFEETVRMTDDGSGRIDRGYLISTLAAVQAIADAHISARYAVPLNPAPEVVKVAIGDVARARLYRGAPPEGVGDQAKAGMKLIERIGEGKLPLPSLAPIPEAASSAPVMVAGGQRQYPHGLRDY